MGTDGVEILVHHGQGLDAGTGAGGMFAGPGGASVVEGDDFQSFVEMAHLQDRKFEGEHTSTVVLSRTVLTGKDADRDTESRLAAEKRHAEALRLPRRPRWTTNTDAEDLQNAEKGAFLAWRRRLASAEEEESLVLTPFERNLEVWRQLWRVTEKSHLLVQVVDARDPLRYRSLDLERMARETNGARGCLLLCNKADLLPEFARRAWADWFVAHGIDHLFFSARESQIEVDEERARERHERAGLVEGVGRDAPFVSTAPTEPTGDPRVAVWPRRALLRELSRRGREYKAACRRWINNREDDDGDLDPAYYDVGDDHEDELSCTVGMVGFPNVGKSSTINALVGDKKVAVAATPGKTRHFQTLLLIDG